MLYWDKRPPKSGPEADEVVPGNEVTGAGDSAIVVYRQMGEIEYPSGKDLQTLLGGVTHMHFLRRVDIVLLTAEKALVCNES